MKWNYFALSVFVVGAALYKAGAPFLPVAFGVGATALMNLRRQRASR